MLGFGLGVVSSNPCSETYKVAAPFSFSDVNFRLGFKILEHGLDMLYCHNRFDMIHELLIMCIVLYNK